MFPGAFKMVEANVTSKLGQLLNLPRNFAYGYDGRWSRLHTPMTTLDLHLKLNQGTPLCVSVKDVDGKGSYLETMSFCVFDVDNRDNLEGAKNVTFLIASYLTFVEKLSTMVTFSGGKGFHIWVFFNRPIKEGDVAKFQYHVMMALGLTRTTTEEYTYEETHVETLIATGQGKVIKIPFSKHPAHPTRYEIPILFSDVMRFSPEAPIDWAVACSILAEAKKVEATAIETIASKITEYDFVSSNPRRTRNSVRISPFTIPSTAPRQDEIAKMIEDTPCLKACYLYVVNRKNKGGFEKRVNIVVALSKAGFTPQEVAVFIRDNINDEEDNANRGMLEYQVRYWYPQTQLCECYIFRRKHFRNFCCPGFCGKSNPSKPTQNVSKTYGLVTHEFMRSIGATDTTNLTMVDDILTPPERQERPAPAPEPPSKTPPPTEPSIPVEPAVEEKPHPEPPKDRTIMTMCEEIVRKRKHIQVFKTTRAGVTTSLVLSAVENGKRVIILEPTNELCEKKLQEIMKVGESYSERIPKFKGIALTDNRTMCLDLMEFATTIRQKFNVFQSEFDKFPFAVKRSCDKCFYRNYEVPFEAGTPLCKSNPVKKQCALITAMRRFGESSVISMTYSKFQNLLKAVDVGSKYAEDLVGQLQLFDIIVFDEFSHYTDTPALDILMSSTWIDGKKAYDMLAQLGEKVRALRRWKDNHTTFKLENFGDDFITRLDESMRSIDKASVKLREVLDDEDTVEIQLNMMQFVGPLFDYMEEKNLSVIEILNMLQITEELPVALTDTPGLDYQHEYHVKKPPIFDHTRNFTSRFGGQIIVTDATMPKVTPQEVFGVEFERYNVGDPNETAKKTMYYCDDWEFYAGNTDASKQVVALDSVVNRLKNVFKYYKPETVMVVAPSILTSKQIQSKMKEQGYPFMNITYQRSDMTIGRDCPFRVMVMVGTPYAPQNTFDWLTVFDADVDKKELLEWNARKWIFQSASRVKDPDGAVNSVVIGVGVPYKNASKLFDSQYLVSPPMVEPSEKEFERQVLKSLHWKQYGTQIENNDLNILCKVAKKDELGGVVADLGKFMKYTNLIQGCPK